MKLTKSLPVIKERNCNASLVLDTRTNRKNVSEYPLAIRFTVERKDFEEFGRRISLFERLIKREMDFFAKEYSLAKELIDRSFLSESLTRSYWLSYNYRRATLEF